ncbi:MAG: helix-turn-helix transcriptional regulator [Pseudomonadota bacterium]|nr:MAG: helix-turn-helix transcriptional regulator [Pseudomonadota bacterium]
MPKHVSVDSLRHAVRRLLAFGAPTLQRAAYALDVSPRTLQRRLAEANLSYSEIVEQVRLEQARQLLGDSEQPVGAIARALGYTDAGSFTRAFERWTGMAPRDFRRQH